MTVATTVQARLDAKTKLGWTPLMCAEGVSVANTEKDWPETVLLIRKLMTERGLNPDKYDQASLGAQISPAVQRGKELHRHSDLCSRWRSPFEERQI